MEKISHKVNYSGVHYHDLFINREKNHMAVSNTLNKVYSQLNLYDDSKCVDLVSSWGQWD